MNDNIRILTGFYYPEWTPPPESGTRTHRITHDMDKRDRKSQPVQARTKIMAILDEFEWKSNEEIAKETGIGLSTVAITTDRMSRTGKIERSKRATVHGKINVFRKK